MADPVYLTYKDATDHASEYLGGAETGRDAQACRRAAVEALRDLANERDWACYQARGIVSTVATYSTGTIAYTNSSRAVALTGGTFPSWAASGVLKIGNARYTVQSRDSSTQLTLTADSNPGADVSSGEEYVLYQDDYPVPVDFGALLTNLFDVDSRREVPQVANRDAFRLTEWTGTASEPLQFALVADANYQGRLAFEFAPAPSSARAYAYRYVRKPRDLRVEEYSDGTISVAGTTAVTGSGTSFSDRHVGCVIRISDTADAPTGKYGENPYYEERVVKSVTSATALVVDAAWSTTLSGKKYVISDPVDVEVPVLGNAYLAGVKAKLAMNRRSDILAAAVAEYRDALQRAACADNRSRVPSGMGGMGEADWQALRLYFGTVT